MRKLRLIKMKWAMSSSKWHDRYMAEMTLNSIFEVKPHAVSYDYSTYLWFFLLLVILQMTFTKHILSFFFSEKFHMSTVALMRIRFIIWPGLFLWKNVYGSQALRSALQISPHTWAYISLWQASAMYSNGSRISQRNGVFYLKIL